MIDRAADTKGELLPCQSLIEILGLLRSGAEQQADRVVSVADQGLYHAHLFVAGESRLVFSKLPVSPDPAQFLRLLKHDSEKLPG